jgi:hypothetical protein
MMWTLLHRRADGTFVIELNGYPYHVTESDPLFAEVAAAAEGVDLPPEPQPEQPPPAPVTLTARQLFAACVPGAPDLGDDARRAAQSPADRRDDRGRCRDG